MTFIIDMRLRPPIPAWTRGSVFQTAMHYPRKCLNFKGARSAWLESLDLLFQEMDAVSIKWGVLMGRAASGSGTIGGVENREIVEAVAQYHNRFLGFLGIDLDDIDRSLPEVREYVHAPNIKGISIEPGSAKRPRWCDDESLDPIYEAALEYDVPVSISLSGLLSALGGHDISWSNPVSIQRAARKYPDLKIIVSHAAWPYANEMVVVALASPNVYISPDLYAATTGMICSDIYVQGTNMFLEDRTLFGSAYPVRDVQDAVADFLKMGWRQEILPNLLYRNAAKLLKIDV